jgi:hypothetical protein
MKRSVFLWIAWCLWAVTNFSLGVWFDHSFLQHCARLQFLQQQFIEVQL